MHPRHPREGSRLGGFEPEVVDGVEFLAIHLWAVLSVIAGLVAKDPARDQHGTELTELHGPAQAPAPGAAAGPAQAPAPGAAASPAQAPAPGAAAGPATGVRTPRTTENAAEGALQGAPAGTPERTTV